jgi:Raf kinase inhibitor-like YbhB/YbcL family protein
LLKRIPVFLSLIEILLISCRTAQPIEPVSQFAVDQTKNRVKSMLLESSAFSNEAQIPSRYTCDGENLSPSLHWSELPEGTQSVALVMDDPDAPLQTFVHWVVYNLPPTVSELSEGAGVKNSPSTGMVVGKNDFGNIGYGGPCPPRGTHRYYFKLYALDRQLTLSAGATKSQLERAMERHVLAQAVLIGHYRRM